MQGICRLSRRWHQQFCHSPAFSARHQRCLPSFIDSRSYRQTRQIPRPTQQPTRSAFQIDKSVLENRSDEDAGFFPHDQSNDSLDPNLVVREYEQIGSDARTRRRVDPHKGLKEETAKVYEELQQLDKETEALKYGPYGPNSPFMQRLAPDHRAKLLQALEEEGVFDDQDDILDMAELERLYEEEGDMDAVEDDPNTVSLHVPRAHQVLVKHFNKALQAMHQGERDDMKALNLWKWYLRCQQRIPGFSTVLTDSVWGTIWTSQADLKVRPQHVVVLAKDMLQAGKDMTSQQTIDYVTALQDSENAAMALAVWEERRAEFESHQTVTTDFYALGIRICTSLKKLAQAQHLAQQGLNAGADPRIMVNLISAWASSDAPNAAEKVWTLYLQTRSLMKDDMPTQIYEQISDLLLDRKMNEMALAVFKDMIAHLRGTDDMKVHKYNDALGSIDIEQSPEDIEKAINQVSLSTMLVLPKQYQNKFFFASWIKKLLGQKRVDAAAMVVDLMYERNITPDATHMNGIIGAWLREGSPESRAKAEALAQDMIQARIKMVQTRNQNLSTRGFNVFRKVMPVTEATNTWLQPVHLNRPVAVANVETFGLLFDYFDQRHQHEQFSSLTQIMLGPAQIRPSTFIINKWLEAEVKLRRTGQFWSMFQSLKEDITYDVDTWRMAWQVSMSEQGLRYTVGGESRKMPNIRQLFHDMTLWAQKLQPRQLRRAQEDFDSYIMAQIIRCFCYQMDIPGTICAVRQLSATFGAAPDDNVVRLITGLVARSLPKQLNANVSYGGRRRPRDKANVNQTVLKDLAQLVDTLEWKQKEYMLDSGRANHVDLNDPEHAASKQIRTNVMVEFLTMIMGRVKKETEDPNRTLRDVARVMGVDIEGIVVDVE